MSPGCVSLLILSLFSVCLAFRTQSVAVKGVLLCGSHPASNVHVKLFDEDHGPDPDDVLDQMMTKEDGSFSLSGSAMELTPIDPEIRIYHDCNDHGKPCQREWVIRIPNKYIFGGSEARESMDLGTINLEVFYQENLRKNYYIYICLF
uniref:Transthyretin-like family protein n=1 Tax=Heterorhabditis bacteriophora TaxID=37862 RepID=A0A1I7XQU3_HETBA